MKNWKKIYDANENKKEVEEAIFMLDKTDFKSKTVRRHEEEHCMLIKRTDSARKYSNCKYTRTQNKTTQIYRANNIQSKRRQVTTP